LLEVGRRQVVNFTHQAVAAAVDAALLEELAEDEQEATATAEAEADE
jgi:hypothetical protein